MSSPTRFHQQLAAYQSYEDFLFGYRLSSPTPTLSQRATSFVLSWVAKVKSQNGNQNSPVSDFGSLVDRVPGSIKSPSTTAPGDVDSLRNQTSKAVGISKRSIGYLSNSSAHSLAETAKFSISDSGYGSICTSLTSSPEPFRTEQQRSERRSLNGPRELIRDEYCERDTCTEPTASGYPDSVASPGCEHSAITPTKSDLDQLSRPELRSPDAPHPLDEHDQHASEKKQHNASDSDNCGLIRDDLCFTDLSYSPQTLDSIETAHPLDGEGRDEPGRSLRDRPTSSANTEGQCCSVTPSPAPMPAKTALHSVEAKLDQLMSLISCLGNEYELGDSNCRHDESSMPMDLSSSDGEAYESHSCSSAHSPWLPSISSCHGSNSTQSYGASSERESVSQQSRESNTIDYGAKRSQQFERDDQEDDSNDGSRKFRKQTPTTKCSENDGSAKKQIPCFIDDCPGKICTYRKFC